MAHPSPVPLSLTPWNRALQPESNQTDVYFSADVETDGPIPGPYSMLSVGITVAGRFDGKTFQRPTNPETFYRELKPISEKWQADALEVNQLDRERLKLEGVDAATAMNDLSEWIQAASVGGEPVLVAYPLSFDWTWLYWYFINFTGFSPFNHSRCFDIKTAFAVKARLPVSGAGRAKLPPRLRPQAPHTHKALDDAQEQAEIFARVFEWNGEP